MSPEATRYLVPRPAGMRRVGDSLVWERPWISAAWESDRLPGTPPRARGREWTPRAVLDAIADLSRGRAGRRPDDLAADLALRLGAPLGACGVSLPKMPAHRHSLSGGSWRVFRLWPERQPKPEPPQTEPKQTGEKLASWAGFAHLVNASRRSVVAVRRGDDPAEADLRALGLVLAAPVHRGDDALLVFARHDDPAAVYGRVLGLVSGWLAELHIVPAMALPDDLSRPAAEVVRLGSVAAVAVWALRQELISEDCEVRVCARCSVTWSVERVWRPSRHTRAGRPAGRERSPRLICSACSAIERDKQRKPKQGTRPEASEVD
jgi:hypothetical protein